MRYALVNGYVLDGSETMTAERKTVLVDGEKIAGVVEPDKSCAGYQMIDLKGKYVLPGLINLHVHLAGNGKPQKKQKNYTKLVDRIFATKTGAAVAKKLVASYAELELKSGVTTIRTVGGLKNLDSTVRDEINAGKRVGPRILASDEGISVPHGHMAGSVAITAHSIEEALAYVDEVKDRVDLIKLMITGGVMDAVKKGSPGELKMDPAMVKAVCEKAHGYGLKVAAHVESPEGVRVALENGVDSIEHGADIDEETLALFKQNEAFLVTTLSPAIPYALFDRSVTNVSETEQYNGNVVFEGVRECAKKALANGIPVGLGNDVGCPWISQYDFYREVVYFHRYAGVSNTFALYTATKRNAELAGVGDITGSIEKGKFADLIVVENNPLDDLHALKNVEMVFYQGKQIKNLKYKRNPLLEKELEPFC